MSEQKRLDRLYSSAPYTTGDAQEWTYEYTWEDFSKAIMPESISTSLSSPIANTKRAIGQYFLEYPEKLLDWEMMKNSGVDTADKVKDRLLSMMVDHW